MIPHRRQVLSSNLWVAYFERNARAATSEDFKPPATRDLPPEIRKVLGASLPGWQLGKTSSGRHLRAAARQYAIAQNDLRFLEAVDLLIAEEQRHGAALGDWLDRVGIPRETWDLGDSLFRLCRYAVPSYVVWASVVVMVEAVAEIYYASVRRIVPCVRLQSECDRILRDEVRHIQFQCEHIAAVRRQWPGFVRVAIGFVELAFYTLVCTAVYLAHGRVMNYAGLSLGQFTATVADKFRHVQRAMDPAGYNFPSEKNAPVWTDERTLIH